MTVKMIRYLLKQEADLVTPTLKTKTQTRTRLFAVRRSTSFVSITVLSVYFLHCFLFSSPLIPPNTDTVPGNAISFSGGVPS
jgi:hypothetical protein